jgi:hypothetical protein
VVYDADGTAKTNVVRALWGLAAGDQQLSDRALVGAP